GVLIYFGDCEESCISDEYCRRYAAVEELNSMFVTRKNIPRRTILKGMGASVSLPILGAMVPAMTPLRSTEVANPKTRLACIEMVHGSAGAVPEGITKNMWSPAAVGSDFDLTPTSMLPLQPFREYLTIV